MQVRILVVCAAALAIAACAPSGHEDDDDTGNGDAGGPGKQPDAGGFNGFIDAGGFSDGDGGVPSTGGGCEKMDILFVIDNSGSMEQEQTNLASNFPMFVQIIESFVTQAGTNLDYRIAITTTDRTFTEIVPPIIPIFPPTMIPHLGNNGKMLTGNNCGYPAGRKFLQRGDANVATVFSCAAKVGIMGDSNEMPLEATKLALVDRVQDGANAGFLRDDALLAIVMLTDENDCSVAGDPVTVTGFDMCEQTGAVAPYLAAIDAVKGGERGRWAVAVIAGQGPGICNSAFGQADEATRLKEFNTAVGTNAVFSSICNGNLATSLMEAFQTFSVACNNIPDPE